MPELIKVYKHNLLGSHDLVGWVDDRGTTFSNERNPLGDPVEWTADARGRVYITFDDVRNMIGWVDADGSVYGEYQRPYRRYGSFARGGGSVFVPDGFEPDLAFTVNSDGEVCHKGILGDRPAGRVEGTSDLRLIGGLALLLLR